MIYPCEHPTPGPAVAMAARMAALVPEIETGRFRLRAPTLGDFPAFAEIDCSERARFIGGPESREDAIADRASIWGNGRNGAENLDSGRLGA